MSKKSVRSSFVSSVIRRPRESSRRQLVERAQVRRLPAERGPVVHELERDLAAAEVDLHGALDRLEDLITRFPARACPPRPSAPQPNGQTRDAPMPTQRPAESGDTRPRSTSRATRERRLARRTSRASWLVLYFYPKDNTPGCTREAQDFTEAAARLKKLGARWSASPRTRSRATPVPGQVRHRVPAPQRPELETHRAYGAWGKKTMYGKEVEGTIRSTFLVAPDGKIAEAWRSVKVDGHVEKVIAPCSG